MDIQGVKAILEKKTPLPDPDSLDVLNGRARAKLEAERGSPLDRPRWKILAEAKPGDRLAIRSRRGTEIALFHYVLERGEKYVFQAENLDGKIMRYALACLVEPS